MLQQLTWVFLQWRFGKNAPVFHGSYGWPQPKSLSKLVQFRSSLISKEKLRNTDSEDSEYCEALRILVSDARSAGLPACLIGRFLLLPLFSCCAFLLRLNQVHPPSPLPPPPPTTTTATTTTIVFTIVITTTTAAAATTRATPTLTPTPTPTPLLLPPFFPKY